jgi:hypothetical protein
MQQAHLYCLATVASPDLEQLVFEREQRFADLQNHLVAAAYQWQTATPESGLVDALRARLMALQEGDVVLGERLHAYRATLAQARVQIQQGQKVLVGYGNQATIGSPRLVDRSIDLQVCFWRARQPV